MGKATLDNVIDKIKEAIKKRFPDLDENELISNVENPAKAKASKEDVHIIQYRRLQLEIGRAHV